MKKWVIFSLLMLFLVYQNCGKPYDSEYSSQLESNPEKEAQEEVDCLDEQGNPIPECVPAAPEKEVRVCDITNGIGMEINEGSGWGSCIVQSCDTGFEIVGNACRANDCDPDEVEYKNRCVDATRDCKVAFGMGEQNFVRGEWRQCVAKRCNAGYEVFNRLCMKKNAPVAKINIHILRRNNGTGNELWSDDFTETTVRYLSSLTLGHVKFVLKTATDIKNTADFESLLQSHSEKYMDLRKFNEITAVITHPGTRDSLGLAYNIKYNYEPFFAARTRSSAEGFEGKAKMAARVMLHELGHNMGMEHDYENTVHMDNHYYLSPMKLVNYVRGLNACSTVSCRCTYSKVYRASCSSGDDD